MIRVQANPTDSRFPKSDRQGSDGIAVMMDVCDDLGVEDEDFMLVSEVLERIAYAVYMNCEAEGKFECSLSSGATYEFKFEARPDGQFEFANQTTTSQEVKA